MNRLGTWMGASAAAVALVLGSGCRNDADRSRESASGGAMGTPVATVGGGRASTADDPNRGMAARDQSRPSTALEPTASAPGGLSNDDKEFLTKAAQGGMLEVALGKEVEKKASSPEIKAFGSRMVQDHGKASNELKQLAEKKGVVLPAELDSEHKADIEKLAKLSGTKLDKEYADDMVEDHEDDVQEFRKAAKEVRDPELRDWAAKTLPVLESHLAMAKEIKAKTKK